MRRSGSYGSFLRVVWGVAGARRGTSFTIGRMSVRHQIRCPGDAGGPRPLDTVAVDDLAALRPDTRGRMRRPSEAGNTSVLNVGRPSPTSAMGVRDGVPNPARPVTGSGRTKGRASFSSAMKIIFDNS